MPRTRRLARYPRADEEYPGGSGSVGAGTKPAGCRPAPRLMDEVRRVLRVKHYSLRTEQAYTAWILRFIRAHGRRHPRELGQREVEAFLSVLAVRDKVVNRSRFPGHA